MANPTYELRVIDSMSAPSTRKTQNADFRKRVPAGVAPNGKLRILPNPQRFISRRADFLRVRPATRKKGAHRSSLSLKSGAGDESRTRDLNLGKVALYQLSYSRNLSCEECELYGLQRVCQEASKIFLKFSKTPGNRGVSGRGRHPQPGGLRR